ncbi:MAG TPA: nucleotidyltransferase family protein [Tenuifilaceae bacterium]|nr:nucleotidyltransferase family protein [Bacteroidales bacterium]HOA10001.1 nucleotidyltransferase family protein [Tenuifilaceae bacterium]NLI87239.1 nucleotidyltransferase family protein [Bacteroidales bacterium]HOC36914.1 nucleotidyltransferase family protein [Tenuifilaceae bacterium]HOG72402.1 nucleotidyltransferase family protein [Tenuifilaceae bacterium]
MKAMILAAGYGTRLLPLTQNKPKALIEVGGKPLLEHCIENLINFGFNEIVINTHYFASQVISFLNSKTFDANIFISDETERLLDTGGGIFKARQFLDGNEPFLVHNVDIISNIDLAELYNIHGQADILATLAVNQRDSSRVFLFNNDMQLAGWRNMVTGKVIISNFSPQLTAYAFCGIHVISPRIFSAIKATGVFSIVDIYLNLCKDYRIQGVNLPNNFILDVGNPDSIAIAESFLHSCNH